MSKTFFDAIWEGLSSSEKKSKLQEDLMGISPCAVYVDDDVDCLEIFSGTAHKFGIESYVTTSTDEAINFIKKNKSRILFIISDYNMAPVNGFEFREKTLEVTGDIPFAILSGYVDRELALKGVEHKITAFLEKPLNDQLISFIRKEVEGRAQTIREEKEMLNGFTDDATNLLENIEELCLELENNPHNPEAISRIFGMVHTIKGSSGFFDPRDLHNFSHKFEDLLKDVQNGSRVVTPKLISVFLKGNDVLKVLINEFKTGVHSEHDINEMVKMFKVEEGNTGVANGAQPDQAQDHQGIVKEQKASEIRVSMPLLNEFMQTSGEMTVIRNMINKTVKNLEKLYMGDKDIGLLSELLEEMHKINGDLQNKITDIRRVPVSSLVKPLARTVRDTALALNKGIDFVVEGDDLRVDNTIAEVLSKSLVHMMRNSIDHGIELPEKRGSLGKPPKGKINLKFSAHGENIIVDIIDDGAGINRNRIREKVVENKMMSQAAADKLTEDELNHMIFDSGLSTAQKVTDFSGRGVGMSMVKDSIESMRGKIHITSKVNEGTHFKIEIPIPKSVLITNCLFVSVAEKYYGIPQDNILKVMEKSQLTDQDYSKLEHAEVIRFNDGLVPLSSLSKLMGINGRESLETLIVIVKSEESIYALSVESVQDIEDAVIKPLNIAVLKNLGIYLGGTFLGDGTIGLIFDMAGIASRLGITNHNFTHLKTQLNPGKQISEDQTKNVIVFDLELAGHYCLEEKDILRIEKIELGLIQESAGQWVIPYRNSAMPLVDLKNILEGTDPKKPLMNGENNQISAVIVQRGEQYLGIVVKEIVDLKKVSTECIPTTKKRPGLKGHYIIEDEVVTLVDLNDALGFSEAIEKEKPQLVDAA